MHISARVVRAGLPALGAILLAAPAAADDTGARAGIVTAVYGTATVSRASLVTPHALKFRDDVLVHDRIATGTESLARILLGGKAVVTVRERSVVTITESSSMSTVDVLSGKIALAVAKERMRAGEAIELRTPNAVAGIRGTVVIAEVAGRGAAASTRFTLLTGTIDVTRLDAARQPIGAAATLTPLQTITIDRALSPVRSITPAEGHAASNAFRLPLNTRPRRGTEWVAREQVAEAVALIDSDRPRGAESRPDVKSDRGGRGDSDDKPQKTKLPASAPSTPIVPADALQASKPKGKDR